jgi:heme/copper-type cytochrome/quinol oxidase subunit 1
MSFTNIHRYSQKRSQYQKAGYPLWNPTNIVFCIGALIILSSSGFTIFSYLVTSVSSRMSYSDANPTSIPWINNQSDCKHTNRTWRDNKCWDYEHNPMF